MSASSPRRSDRSLTLERGLRLLHIIGEHPEGLSVSALATVMRTHRASVYRLLRPLADQRLVVRDVNGRHTLGVGVIELASRVWPRLQAAARPEMRALADGLGATTALTLRDAGEALVVLVVEPRGSGMHLTYRPGMRHTLDVAASGIAMLAGGPPLPGERDAVVLARQRGWACSSGEFLAGAQASAPRSGPAQASHRPRSAPSGSRRATRLRQESRPWPRRTGSPPRSVVQQALGDADAHGVFRAS